MGFRISSNFVWADGHVVEEYVDGSIDRNYVHGNMFIDELVLFEDSSGDYHYYLQDFRYTVYALVDDTGTVEERYRFDPYGKRTVVTDDGSIDENYGFTGRYHDDSDETDLIYFRNRWMSPEMGRFINRDPIEYQDGMNLYAAWFVINRTDPMGQVAIGDPCCEPPSYPAKIAYSVRIHDKKNVNTKGSITVLKVTTSGGPAHNLSWQIWSCSYGKEPPKRHFSHKLLARPKDYHMVTNITISWVSCEERVWTQMSKQFGLGDFVYTGWLDTLNPYKHGWEWKPRAGFKRRYRIYYP